MLRSCLLGAFVPYTLLGFSKLRVDGLESKFKVA